VCASRPSIPTATGPRRAPGCWRGCWVAARDHRACSGRMPGCQPTHDAARASDRRQG
jgi:hypothetical protein